MAKPIATQDVVEDAIRTLIAQGKEPTVIGVRELIGGGSFSTVKRWLNAWRQRQAEISENQTPAPDEVSDKAQEFGQQLWMYAHRAAQRDVAIVRAQAQEKVDEAQADLAEALQEVSRLEDADQGQQVRLDALQRDLATRSEELSQARAQAARVVDLERALSAAQEELAQARLVAQERSDLAARVTGERDAAQAQVRELTLLLRGPDPEKQPESVPQTPNTP